MYKITIFSPGKHKESWLTESLAEYEKRLQPHMEIHWVFAKNSEHLALLLKKEPFFLALTPAAKQFSSEEFSYFLTDMLEKNGCRLQFVIGGAEGLSPSILQAAKGTISLSSMTFTHQMTRLLLLEQLYRAIEIQKGSGYHK